MKKLLIMLMVVAMASFLFVGCLGGGVTPPVDDEDEDGVTPPATVAPIITAVTDINIASSATQYVNKAEALDGIIVTGTAPTYSEVKVYINGITAGTGDAGVNGVFNVQVANADLIKAAKVEGAKVLHATATDLGLPESASSNVINFTLDTVTPFIASSVGRAGTAAVATVVGTSVVEVTGSDTGDFFHNEVVNDPALLVGGVWKIEIQNILDNPNILANPGSQVRNAVNYVNILGVVDSGDVVTFRITSPSSVVTTYSYSYMNSLQTFTTLVLGVSVDFPSAAGVYNALSFNDIGAEVYLTVVAPVTAIPGYIDCTFNEPVTGASVLTPTTAGWIAFAATTPLLPGVTVRSSTVARLTESVAGNPLVPGVAYSATVNGIVDLADNPSGLISTTGIVIP